MTALLEAFVLRAALASVGVALIAGPLGCFVVWRRMAYFGDAVAHSALLGVALGLALGLPVLAATLMVSLLMASGVAAFSLQRAYAPDTTLGVFAHAALAIGMVAISQIDGARVDLIGYLFGDILAVERGDLLVIWGAAAGLGAALAWFWRPLVNATLSEELAQAEGDQPARAELGLLLALAMLIAVAMQIVGLLMVTAMLILPAAAARPFARRPESMAAGAALIGAVGACLGLGLSTALDAPTGPSIVATLFGCFVVSTLAAAIRAARRSR